MTQYAQNTNVSSDKSRSEIERTLQRYGADQFMYANSRERAIIAFHCANRMVKFEMPLPDPHSREFTHTPNRGTKRDENGRAAAYEQAVRQKWRALALAIKAKLEAVESGITTFEEEFLAHIVLPGGGTVGRHLIPKLEDAYKSGELPPLLPQL